MMPSTAHSDITQNTAVDDTASMEPVPPPPMVTLNGRSKAQKVMTTGSIDMSEYFQGPRDISKHSKWPTFMRIHGSILPEMILPMIFMAVWSTAITLISKFVYELKVDSILLTILGFVVGLGLSFRGSTAYERYIEGRKQWTQLTQISQAMGRTIWQHTSEREGDLGKQDLLAKLSAMNLIYAFSVALKHRLRFEPYQHYEDLEGLIGHLDTFARDAEGPEADAARRKGAIKRTGEYLGVSFAESNPRKTLKKARRPLGNLPLEILSYIGAYVDSIVENGTITNPIHQATLINGLNNLSDVLTGTDRVLNTPLPIAYSIAISQMTWIYVIVLPFQLYKALEWITIPGTMVGSYIILALALIGNEIENPFGNDVNDLPLDSYCDQISMDLDILSSAPRRRATALANPNNKVLFPLSENGYRDWQMRNEMDIRDALRMKAALNPSTRRSMAREEDDQLSPKPKLEATTGEVSA